jgi:hypothetical protein
LSTQSALEAHPDQRGVGFVVMLPATSDKTVDVRRPGEGLMVRTQRELRPRYRATSVHG